MFELDKHCTRAFNALTAPLDYAPYVRNSGFTSGRISRVLKMQRC
ncbi:hypothetical protein [Burkholderia vietnamiensis]|nr:hypothetical protein [Burkholderia vietnamiensis]